MHVTAKRSKPETATADLLAVFLWEDTAVAAQGAVRDLDTRLEGLVHDYLDSGDFRGRLNTTLLLRTQGRLKAPRLLLVGLGPPQAFTLDHLRQAAATAATTARRLGASTVAMVPPACDTPLAEVGHALTEGAVLGLYRLRKYKTGQDDDAPEPLRAVHLLTSGGSPQKALTQGIERGSIIAAAVTMARDLINSPGNEVTPSTLADTARALAKGTSLRCQVLTQNDMRKLGMGCLLGVAQGSTQPPVLIMLEHAPSQAQATDPPVVLVGKGITFDSGGISIKPAASMEDMKMDMAGGAAVLATMQALSRLGYPGRVVGMVPASENLPSGTAVKPGDILRAMSGKTVEVINTDAEGRLVLADALSYAVANLAPARIIDLATLTGAVVVALGQHATGMMGTDTEMMERLRAAGEHTAERVWQLPLFEAYSKQISSDFADIKNSGGREAGSITGGAFLKAFVGDTPWVHLDIAGTAWTRDGNPYTPKGATGVGVRLLIRTLEAMAAERSAAATA